MLELAPVDHTRKADSLTAAPSFLCLLAGSRDSLGQESFFSTTSERFSDWGSRKEVSDQIRRRRLLREENGEASVEKWDRSLALCQADAFLPHTLPDMGTAASASASTSNSPKRL